MCKQRRVTKDKYVCMYVCMYICTIFSFACMHVRCVCVCVCVLCVCVHVHACVCNFPCISLRWPAKTTHSLIIIRNKCMANQIHTDNYEKWQTIYLDTSSFALYNIFGVQNNRRPLAHAYAHACRVNGFCTALSTQRKKSSHAIKAWCVRGTAIVEA